MKNPVWKCLKDSKQRFKHYNKWPYCIVLYRHIITLISSLFQWIEIWQTGKSKHFLVHFLNRSLSHTYMRIVNVSPNVDWITVCYCLVVCGFLLGLFDCCVYLLKLALVSVWNKALLRVHISSYYTLSNTIIFIYNT